MDTLFVRVGREPELNMQNNLTALQIDALKEASNIGVGHAASALSQMLRKKIMITVTRTEIIPSELFLKNIVGDIEAIVVTVYLQTLGDAQGVLVFMFKKESALKLSDLLLSRSLGDTKFIDEKAQSALKELGSILTGVFLSVISEMFNLKVLHKAPRYAFDKAEVVMRAVCRENFGDSNERLCLATEFIEATNKITGTFAFVPAEESMKIILEKVKTK